MNEKTEIQQESDDNNTVLVDIPPCYDYSSPPPPSYVQSTLRLCYNNQPYISDSDQALYHSQQQSLANDDMSDSWSYIARLPFHQRIAHYLRSWAHTIYDGRLIFFAFFVFFSLVVLGLVVAFIAVPGLINYH